MNLITTQSPTAIVVTDQNRVFTTSLVLAEKFDKKHYNVLRDIEDILKKCPDEAFRRLNFEATFRDIPGPKNSTRQEKAYHLTRQGFTLAAMGFTGDKAFLWKIAFISAFDRMEAQLNGLLATEHHALVAALFGRHPKWQQLVEDTQAGYPQRLIAQFNGMNVRNVRRMQQRIRAAGLACHAPARLH